MPWYHIASANMNSGSGNFEACWSWYSNGSGEWLEIKAGFLVTLCSADSNRDRVLNQGLMKLWVARQEVREVGGPAACGTSALHCNQVGLTTLVLRPRESM